MTNALERETIEPQDLDLNSQWQLFRHRLLNPVSTAYHYHDSTYTPSDGWLRLKKQFIEAAEGNARPEMFNATEEIHTSAEEFIQTGRDSDWSVRDQVNDLFDKGAETNKLFEKTLKVER